MVVNDGDVSVFDQCDDFFSFVLPADSEVEHLVSVTKCDAAFVDFVVSNFPDGVTAGGCGFGDEPVSGCGSVSSDGSVGSDVVVVVTEFIELLLELLQAVGCGLGGEEQFQGLPEPLDFALRGGFVGASILLLDAL